MHHSDNLRELFVNRYTTSLHSQINSQFVNETEILIDKFFLCTFHIGAYYSVTDVVTKKVDQNAPMQMVLYTV